MGKKTSKMYGRAIIQPSTLNKETREVDVVFATESPVQRWGWNEEYDEVLSCVEPSVRMERVNNGLPVMDCHNTYSVLNQVGRSSKVWFDNDKKELWARLRFSKRSAVDGLFQDIADGIVTDISVGYRVYKFEREPQGEGKRPIYRAVDWMPTEISLAPVPADINSGVRTAASENDVAIVDKINNPQTRNEMKKITCPECGHEFEVEEADSYTCPECKHEFAAEEAGKRSNPQPAPAAPDVAAVRAQASQEEQARLDAILVSTRAAKLEDAFAIELFQGKKPIHECRQAIIEKVIAGQTPPVNGVHTMRVGVEAIDKKRDAIRGAILHRVQPSVFKLGDQSREFRGMTLVEMGRELLTERGVSVRGLDKMEVARLVFSRTHGSSDFPLLMEGAIDKMLRADYKYAEEFWPLISRQTSNNDFRAKNLYQVGSHNGMKEMAEGEEIKYTTLVEGKQSIRVKSYAEGIKFTRQAFINDDLDALAIIPSAFVKDWDEKRGDLVWSLLIDNVTMANDGKDLFSTGHNNLLTGADSALSEESLAKALALFKKQTAIDGKRRIRVVPKYLVVPVELEVTARKLITAVTASNTKDVNVFANVFTPIVEPRLVKPTEWYLSADPNAVDSLYHSYLQGEEDLRVNSEDDFSTDTMKFGVRGEFGTAAVDYRGLVKATGKA